MYKKSKILRAVRKELEAGNLLLVAITRAGLRSHQTLDNWRKRPMIARYIDKCMGKSDEKRIVSVEDAQFKSAINGSTRAQETFLFNRAPNRWKKDKSDLLHEGKDINVNVNVYPNRITVFKDLGNGLKDNVDDGRTSDPHAHEGAGSNRIKEEIQST